MQLYRFEMIAESKYHIISMQWACLHLLTWHVREEQNALIEAKCEQLIPQLLEYGHPDAERKWRISKHQRVPQVKDFVQREDVCKIYYQLLYVYVMFWQVLALFNNSLSNYPVF